MISKMRQMKVDMDYIKSNLPCNIDLLVHDCLQDTSEVEIMAQGAKANLSKSYACLPAASTMSALNTSATPFLIKGVSKLDSEFQNARSIPQNQRRLINIDYIQDLDTGKLK